MSHLYPDAVAPLLAALHTLRDNGPTIRADGICPHIYSYMQQHHRDNKQLREAVRCMQHHLMETWPDSSGDSSFPVDSYKEYFSISTADKWQNPRRLQLLNWMIAQLEAKP